MAQLEYYSTAIQTAIQYFHRHECEYLVCPEQLIAPEILANWYTDIDPNQLKKVPKLTKSSTS
ncbi:26256_t:CDS:2 [Gigaspora rosea]|nr:26256_t:CDS:2 [Gigaspora rosea]